MLRSLGSTPMQVSAVAMGCWPIAGMTSLNVTREQSLSTLRAARESGINFFDTAYCYGPDGESERMIGEVLGAERDEVVIATKAGISWNPDGSRRLDAKPETIKRHFRESCRRLGAERVDLFYLHAPDPGLPIEDSAGAFRELYDEQQVRAVGVSNVSLEQLRAFDQVCPVHCVQPPYNMLQREIERDLLPWCHERDIAVCVYWPLLKGLLAGKLPRDHVFAPQDGRAKYPMFQGEQWQRNQDLVDDLRPIAGELGCSVATLVVAWTIGQPNITTALCGAKRPDQIQESAAAMSLQLDESVRNKIAAALSRRGEVVSRGAV
ncbi:MAG: aldo/keto reductase [Planctomycetales bacterium]|nr:aldo/keto reductase [Planctomycetales bacterium]